MAGVKGSDPVPTLQPPRPKLPPEYPDLFGKRRELAKVQMLEREIGFLREELRCIEGIEPASRSCKELADFVTGNLDPLLPIRTKGSRTSCCSWKWICGLPRFLFSWICCGGCCCCCSSQREKKRNFCRCDCDKITCGSCCSTCFSCKLPKCHCFSCRSSHCCNRNRCCLPRCWFCSFPRCSNSCFQCKCNFKCPKLKLCCCFPCHSNCCFPCHSNCCCCYIC